MAHVPRHANNPCQPDLPEHEQVPAKIWELLRRNESFKKTVARLAQLDERMNLAMAKIKALKDQGAVPGQDTPDGRELESECRRRTNAKYRAEGMLENVRKTHPFAADALQWLVPEPWFEVRHEIIAPDADLTQSKYPPIRVVRLESGSTPDPTDKPNWQEFKSRGEFDAESARNLAGGAPWVRGPYLIFSVAEDPRLQGSRINPIKEWKDYESSHGPFSLADTWRFVPIGLKRTFCWLWRKRDSREKNSLTGCRTDAPQEQETDFFQNWCLMERFSRAAKSGQLEAEDFVRSLRFDNFAKNYRVFAFPKSIRTRSEARRVSEWVLEQLAAGLPFRENEVLGTPLQWDIFLTIEAEMAGGAPYREALMTSFDKVHLRDENWQEGQPIPDQRVLWGQRGASWENDYRFIHSPTANTGLIQRSFPRCDTVIPLSDSLSGS